MTMSLSSSSALCLLETLAKTNADIFRNQIVQLLTSNDALCFAMCSKHCRAVVLEAKLRIPKVLKITSLQTLSLAVKLGMELSVDTLKRAIESGKVEIVKALVRDHRCAVDSTCCSFSAKIGSLRILEFLRGEDVQCNHNAIARAAMSGHWDIVRYLRERQCPWSKSLVRAYAELNGKHMLRYIERAHDLENDIYEDMQTDLVEF